MSIIGICTSTRFTRLIHFNIFRTSRQYLMVKAAFIIIALISTFLIGAILLFNPTSSLTDSFLDSTLEIYQLETNFQQSIDVYQLKVIIILRILTLCLLFELLKQTKQITHAAYKSTIKKIKSAYTIIQLSIKLGIPRPQCKQIYKQYNKTRSEKIFDPLSVSIKDTLKSLIIINILKDIRYFRNLYPDFYIPLIPLLKLRSVSAGECVYNQGDTNTIIYFLIYGCCAYVGRSINDPKKIAPFVYINYGDTIGNIDFEGLSDGRVYTCTAIEDSYLLYFQPQVYLNHQEPHDSENSFTELLDLLMDNSFKKLQALKQFHLHGGSKPSTARINKNEPGKKNYKPKETRTHLEVIEEETLSKEGSYNESKGSNSGTSTPRTGKMGAQIINKLHVIECLIARASKKEIIPCSLNTCAEKQKLLQ